MGCEVASHKKECTRLEKQIVYVRVMSTVREVMYKIGSPPYAFALVPPYPFLPPAIPPPSTPCLAYSLHVLWHSHGTDIFLDPAGLFPSLCVCSSENTSLTVRVCRCVSRAVGLDDHFKQKQLTAR